MDLNEISIFVQVVQSGGFSKAAKKLGMPNSTVSSKVSSLEKRLATTLIQRTTRQLKVTQVGQSFYEMCIKGLQEIQEAEREIASAQSEPQGLLRVTAPVELGSKVLPALVSRYLAHFPKTQVEIELSDSVSYLVGEKFDVALRVGKLEDSSLMARKLGLVDYGLYAAAKYIKARGNPKQVQDLREHTCLTFDPIGSEEWKLESKKGTAKVTISGRVTLNNLSALKEFLLQGDGIAYFPNFLAKDELASKKLVRVLPEWGSSPRPLHLVYPAQKHLSPKLSAFLTLAMEMLPEWFR